jgi:hypothetical protein
MRSAIEFASKLSVFVVPNELICACWDGGRGHGGEMRTRCCVASPRLEKLMFTADKREIESCCSDVSRVDQSLTLRFDSDTRDHAMTPETTRVFQKKPMSVWLFQVSICLIVHHKYDPTMR